jgi:hypothetical protein
MRTLADTGIAVDKSRLLVLGISMKESPAS